MKVSVVPELALRDATSAIPVRRDQYRVTWRHFPIHLRCTKESEWRAHSGKRHRAIISRLVSIRCGAKYLQEPHRTQCENASAIVGLFIEASW
jgi:hypothetical protein